MVPQVSRQGLFGLGVPELALVAGAAALLFGAPQACGYTANWALSGFTNLIVL